MTHVLRPEGEGRASVCPIEWAFDNSFWVSGEPREAESLAAIGRRELSELAAHAIVRPPALIDAYTAPDGRRARTYRFFYASRALALSRSRALALNGALCEVLEYVIAPHTHYTYIPKYYRDHV